MSLTPVLLAQLLQLAVDEVLLLSRQATGAVLAVGLPELGKPVLDDSGILFTRKQAEALAEADVPTTSARRSEEAGRTRRARA
jgi:hypothetical protein